MCVIFDYFYLSFDISCNKTVSNEDIHIQALYVVVYMYVDCIYMDWIELAQDRNHWRALANTVMNLRVP
jgi:hypothetical protein